MGNLDWKGEQWEYTTKSFGIAITASSLMTERLTMSSLLFVRIILFISADAPPVSGIKFFIFCLSELSKNS